MSLSKAGSFPCSCARPPGPAMCEGLGSCPRVKPPCRVLTDGGLATGTKQPVKRALDIRGENGRSAAGGRRQQWLCGVQLGARPQRSLKIYTPAGSSGGASLLAGGPACIRRVWQAHDHGMSFNGLRPPLRRPHCASVRRFQPRQPAGASPRSLRHWHIGLTQVTRCTDTPWRPRYPMSAPSRADGVSASHWFCLVVLLLAPHPRGAHKLSLGSRPPPANWTLVQSSARAPGRGSMPGPFFIFMAHIFLIVKNLPHHQASARGAAPPGAPPGCDVTTHGVELGHPHPQTPGRLLCGLPQPEFHRTVGTESGQAARAGAGLGLRGRQRSRSVEPGGAVLAAACER